MRFLVLLSFTLSLFLLPLLSHGQIKHRGLQKIYLNNGWILKGDTSLTENGQKLKIQTPDHQVFIYPLGQVDSIRAGKFIASRESEIGFRNMLQLGFLLHNPEPLPGVDPNLIANFFSLSLQYTASYTTKSGISVGLGSGVNLFSRGYVVPVYADIRGDLGRGLIRPHIYGQVGTSIPIYGRESLTDFWGNQLFEEFEADGGLLVEVGAGIKLMATENYAWLISLGWRMQNITEVYKQWEIRYKDEYSFQRISFQIACMF